jgi:DNA-binding response OmpR family regulator
VTAAANCEEAFTYINDHDYDLALLDLNLPDMSGLTILAKLKQISPDTVAIILTAHASISSSVEALRKGSHDYLLKPCRANELRESIERGLTKRHNLLQQRRLVSQLGHLAGVLQDMQDNPDDDDKLKNITSDDGKADFALNSEGYQVENSLANTESQDRVGANPTPQEDAAASEQLLQHQGLTIDPVRHTITYRDEQLTLSSTEFDLLSYLVGQAPRVIPPLELANTVLGYDCDAEEAGEIIRQHVYRMRRKIKAATSETEIIRTVRSVGYTIDF